ncbi:MAG TPA: hypothetical protein VK559_09165 [Ferruginibacter sp.]|nr:hypothetical protein [Ferruginibacter sp.]
MTTKQLYRGIKTSVFSAALLLAFSTANAQHRGGGDEPAFDQGSNTITVGLGIGDGEGAYDYYGDDNHFGPPAIAVTYDHGIVGDVGPGTIGVGGIVSGKTSWDNNNGDKLTWSSFEVGVRADYHLTILKDKNNKFDPYAGVTIGGRFNHFHEENTSYNSSSTDVVVAPFVGAKYNFRPGFGVYAEASVDISILRAGIAFNF